MEIKDDYYIWKKDEAIQEPIHINGTTFNMDQLACSCRLPSCIQQKISIELLSRLSKLNQVLDIESLTILDGYRCEAHQDELTKLGYQTSEGLSQHCLGKATDVLKPVSLDIKIFLQHAKDLFFSLGVASGWLHLDLRPKRIDGTHRIWTYR